MSTPSGVGRPARVGTRGYLLVAGRVPMSPEEGSPEPPHERPLRRPFRVLCGAGPLRGVCCAYTARLGIGLPCGNLPMRHRAAFSRAMHRPLVAACAAAPRAQRSPFGAGDVLFRRLLVVFDLTDTKKPVIGLATQNPQYTPVSQASQRNINRSRAGCRRRCRIGSCGGVARGTLRVACRASCKGERDKVGSACVPMDLPASSRSCLPSRS